MESRLRNSVLKSEELYAKVKNFKSAFLLILRYIESAYFFDNSDIYLQKALNVLINIKAEAADDIRFKLLEIYINIKFGKNDEVREMFKKLLKYKSWYKNHNPREYALLYMLMAENEFSKDNSSKGKKFFNKFRTMITEIPNNSTMKLIESDFLYRYYYEDELADSIILDESRKSRSPISYCVVTDMFMEGSFSFNDVAGNLNKLMKWNIENDIADEKLINKLEGYFIERPELQEACIKNIELLYEKYNRKETLGILCGFYNENKVFDKKALRAYLFAKENRILTNSMDYGFVYCAFKNEYYDVDVRIVQKLLLEDSWTDEEFKAYIYHIILINDNMTYLANANKEKILSFGEMSFSSGKSGIYYNSIYKFMVDSDNTNKRLMKYVFEQLFSYEVEILNSKVKYVWILEDVKQEVEAYVAKGDKISINAVNGDFDIYCLGQKQRSFLNVSQSVKLKKKMLKVNASICKMFWDKGYSSTELLTYLADYYIERDEIDEKSIRILKEILEHNEISYAFRCRIGAILGNYYTEKKEYYTSSAYFSILDPKDLKQDEFNSAIIGFSQIGEPEKAMKLMEFDLKKVNDNAKLSFCLSAIRKRVYKKESTEMAVGLILNGRTDQELISYVQSNYSGTVKELVKIKNMFEVLRIDTFTISQKVLNEAISQKILDDDVQDIFAQVYALEYETGVTKDFMKYVQRSILAEYKDINSNMLKTLEKEYEKYDNEYTMYALCGAYLMKDMPIKDEMLKLAVQSMESKGILFPLFKKYKDKSQRFSYIDKNVVFAYNADKGKNVYLYHRQKGNEEWIEEKMQYVKIGLYISVLVVFYGEEIEYYIKEEDSVEEFKVNRCINNDAQRLNKNEDELYYDINNALIYSQTLDYSEVERLILKMQKCRGNVNLVGCVL